MMFKVALYLLTTPETKDCSIILQGTPAKILGQAVKC